MKLVKTELKNTFTNFEKNIPSFIEEGMSALNALLKISDIACTTEEEYLKNHPDIDRDEIGDFDTYQIDELATILELPYPNNIKLFKDSLCGFNFVINRRARDFMQYLDRVLTRVENADINYIPLTQKEQETLKDDIVQALGHLSILLYYGLKLNETFDTGEFVDINFQNYVIAHNFDLMQTIKMLRKVSEAFRPRLPFFEDNPELEDAFYNAVGPYGFDSELMEDLLAYEDIKYIIDNPNLDFESYIQDKLDKARETLNRTK